MTWTRWGRVGSSGQYAVLGDGDLSTASSFFTKKFKDKSGLPWTDRLNPPKKNKYTFLERKYKGNGSDDQGCNHVEAKDKLSRKGLQKTEPQLADTPPIIESKLPEPVQGLMEMIFNRQYFANTMAKMSYDTDKLPLGDLSQRTIERGFEILKEIAELMHDPALADEKHNMTYGQALEESSNAFYSTIPHNFGRSRAPVICTEERLLREANLMESLTDMEIAGKIMQNTGRAGDEHTLDRQFASLGLQEMTPRQYSSTLAPQ